jgi:hypothetical protein
MALCLLAGSATVPLGVMALTLAWTHSVEKTRWEEDWRLGPQGLVLVESRVQATGAGMEPPAEAEFDGRWWRWQPKQAPLAEIVLRRSGATADWTLCRAGRCEPIGALLPADADPVTLTRCR